MDGCTTESSDVTAAPVRKSDEKDKRCCEPKSMALGSVYRPSSFTFDAAADAEISSKAR